MTSFPLVTSYQIEGRGAAQSPTSKSTPNLQFKTEPDGPSPAVAVLKQYSAEPSPEAAAANEVLAKLAGSRTPGQVMQDLEVIKGDASEQNANVEEQANRTRERLQQTYGAIQQASNRISGVSTALSGVSVLAG